MGLWIRLGDKAGTPLLAPTHTSQGPAGLPGAATGPGR